MADYNSAYTGAQVDDGIAKANTAQQPPAEGAFVDGDKTKLDGIEALADVTDTTNVTAAGALMDSELTDIAAVKALDQGVATTDDPTFTGIDLAAIAASKAVTAVDVFVYDTSKDSDGGAWRKRTQHTSWYNETLNTATRGSRREFPAVAVIVAGGANEDVIIYDADDPALPMWKILQGNTTWRSTESKKVEAKNGVLAIGLTSAANPTFETKNRLDLVNFVADKVESSGVTGGSYLGTVPLSEFTLTGNFTTIGAGASVYPLVSKNINDVAMTVLPDAPIDPATGLPVPTIAVATDGGVSVITDSGAVYDSAKTTGATDTTIDGERLRIAFTDSDVLAYDIASIASDGFTGDIYDPATTPALLGTTTSLAQAASGSSTGLTLLFEDQATPANGMIARVTSSYNSGYQNGDIKGAFLADTDDTDLVGSGELVTNGTFDTDTSGWTPFNNAVILVVSGRMRIANGATGRAGAGQSFSTIIGQTYQLTLDAIPGSAPDAFTYVGEAIGSASVAALVNVDGVGLQLTFVAENTTTWVNLLPSNTGLGNYIDVDNISVKLADADRSVNNNGLIVNGTVARSPVATGADLVAYSGFSASNYLEQPYNSDLDFGTGDFCVMGWVKMGASGVQRPILSKGPVGSNPSPYFEIQQLTDNRIAWVGNNSSSKIETPILSAATHSHVAFIRAAGVGYLYVNGSLVSSATNTDNYDHSNTDVLRFGFRHDGFTDTFNGSLALLRISTTAPTAEQIKKIYEDEKVLFQENAACTLYGASDAVTALAFDDSTQMLHVGTSAGRSVFQGLRRVSNTTTAVGTAISASNNLIVED